MCIRDRATDALKFETSMSYDKRDIITPTTDVGAGSVSYTHLDVYKRQDEDNISMNMWMKGAPERKVFSALSPMTEGSVSYTHLDVYKRQI